MSLPQRTSNIIASLVASLEDADATAALKPEQLLLIPPEKILSHFEGCCKHVRDLATSDGLGPIDYDSWRIYQYTDTYGTPYAIEVNTLIESPKETFVEYVNYRGQLEREGCLEPGFGRADTPYSCVTRRGDLTDAVTSVRVTIEGSEGLVEEISYVGDVCQVAVSHPDGTNEGLFFLGEKVVVMTRQGKIISFLGDEVIVGERLVPRP